MFKKLALLFSLMLPFCFMAEDLDARGRGGGSRGGSSFRSSSSRSSSSRSSSRSSRPSSSRSSRSSTRSSSKSTGRSKQAAAHKKSLAQKKAYDKAKKSGKAFKTKEAAAKDFKSKNAAAFKPGGKYTSSYKTKPATRPSHIPQTTSVGGKNYNVTYNVNHGGYGYMGPSGAWVAYSVASDMAMMSMLMSRSGYHIGGPPTVVAAPSAGLGLFTWLMIIVGAALVIGFIVKFSTE